MTEGSNERADGMRMMRKTTRRLWLLAGLLAFGAGANVAACQKKKGKKSSDITKQMMAKEGRSMIAAIKQGARAYRAEFSRYATTGVNEGDYYPRLGSAGRAHALGDRPPPARVHAVTAPGHDDDGAGVDPVRRVIAGDPDGQVVEPISVVVARNQSRAQGGADERSAR